MDDARPQTMRERALVLARTRGVVRARDFTTAGIALTVNLLGKIVWELPYYLGVPVAAAIFIGGHTVNLMINTLGAFVHSLRLNYVEFFGTFYEGGGRAFVPFKAERKYSK